MQKQAWFASFLHLFRTVSVVVLGIAALVAAVCLLIGWHTVRQFGQGLTYAGIAAWLFGLASVITSLGLTRGADYQYAQSVGVRSMDENVREAMKESKESYGFLWLMVTVGAILLAIGLLIAQLV